jgi:hypothetical protein
MDSLAPARSVAMRPSALPNSSRRFPIGSNARINANRSHAKARSVFTEANEGNGGGQRLVTTWNVASLVSYTKINMSKNNQRQARTPVRRSEPDGAERNGDFSMVSKFILKKLNQWVTKMGVFLRLT